MYALIAVAMAKTAVEIDPTDASGHNLIAQDAYAQKDYQTALNEFMKACQYDSSNYSYFYNLGKTQYVLKKYNEDAYDGFISIIFHINDKINMP